MTAGTITVSTVILQTRSTTLAPSTTLYRSTNTATLTPSAPLANLTVYTATVKSGPSGVKDLAGNALASDFIWSFTTLPDTIPPTVTSVTPASGATGIALTTAVTATFSDPMT